MARKLPPNRHPGLDVHWHIPKRRKPWVSTPDGVPTSRSTPVSAQFIVNNYGTDLAVNASVPTITGPTVGYSNQVVFNQFAGIRNPGWRDAIRRGENATTAASGLAYTGQRGFSSFSLTADHPNFGYHTREIWGRFTESTWDPIPDVPSPTATDVRNHAIRKLYDSIDAARSSVESGQDFGEYEQSLKSFRRPCDALRTYSLELIPRLKKSVEGIKEFRRLSKALAETYLEWHFGWKPLAEDVAEAYVGLTANDHFDVVPVYGGGYAIYSGSSSRVSNGAAEISYYASIQKSSKYRFRIKGAVRTECSNKGRLPPLRVLQLDLPHFIPTIWDLIPYSFIADYFVNIGDIVRAWSLGTRNMTWGCITERWETTKQVSYTLADDLNKQLWVGYKYQGFGSGSNDRLVTTKFQRSSLVPGTLVPDLQFKLPVSPWPYINMGALLLSEALPFQRQLQQKFKNLF